MWKKLALTLLVLLLVAAGVVFYLWRQVTALPDWYGELAAGDAPAPAEASDGHLQWSAAPGDEKKKVLKNFHRRAAKKSPDVAAVIKASRATYEDGTLEAGVVADLTKLPTQKLNDSERSLYQRARESFPSLTDRDVYIGVEDPSPVFKDGKFEIGPDARVKIGNLTYSLDSAAERLGMTPDKLRTELETQFRQLGIGAPK